MALESLVQDNEVYGDYNSLRIEDLENRRKWKIVAYADSRDARKTGTHSALREANGKSLPVTTFKTLISDFIDCVWIKDIDEEYSRGREIPVDGIVALLEEKGLDGSIIERVDKNLAKTFTDYKRKLK